MVDETLKSAEGAGPRARRATTAEILLDGLDPAKGAVVVVDMQNDFCDPAGAMATGGVDVSASARALAPLEEVLGDARRHGALVVFVRLESEPRSITDAQRLVAAANGKPEVWVCGPGTWGAEIHDSLHVLESDLVVTKHLYSAFAGTGLDELLRSRGIDHVIVTGTTANVCVQATAMDAYLHGFSVVVARDLVGFVNSVAADAALANLAGYYALVCTSEALSTAWQRRAEREAAQPS